MTTTDLCVCARAREKVHAPKHVRKETTTAFIALRVDARQSHTSTSTLYALEVAEIWTWNVPSKAVAYCKSRLNIYISGGASLKQSSSLTLRKKRHAGSPRPKKRRTEAEHTMPAGLRSNLHGMSCAQNWSELAAVRTCKTTLPHTPHSKTRVAAISSKRGVWDR